MDYQYGGHGYSFGAAKQKYRAEISYQGKKYSSNLYLSEKEAAYNADRLIYKCRGDGPDVLFNIGLTTEEKRRLDALTFEQMMDDYRSKGFVHSRGTSAFRGVSWNMKTKKWRVNISDAGTQCSIGYFSSELEAARAYDAAARKLNKSEKELNFPESVCNEAEELAPHAEIWINEMNAAKHLPTAPSQTKFSKQKQGKVSRTGGTTDDDTSGLVLEGERQLDTSTCEQSIADSGPKGTSLTKGSSTSRRIGRRKGENTLPGPKSTEAPYALVEGVDNLDANSQENDTRQAGGMELDWACRESSDDWDATSSEGFDDDEDLDEMMDVLGSDDWDGWDAAEEDMDEEMSPNGPSQEDTQVDVPAPPREKSIRLLEGDWEKWYDPDLVDSEWYQLPEPGEMPSMITEEELCLFQSRMDRLAAGEQMTPEELMAGLSGVIEREQEFLAAASDEAAEEPYPVAVKRLKKLAEVQRLQLEELERRHEQEIQLIRLPGGIEYPAYWDAPEGAIDATEGAAGNVGDTEGGKQRQHDGHTTMPRGARCIDAGVQPQHIDQEGVPSDTVPPETAEQVAQLGHAQCLLSDTQPPIFSDVTNGQQTQNVNQSCLGKQSTDSVGRDALQAETSTSTEAAPVSFGVTAVKVTDAEMAEFLSFVNSGMSEALQL